MILNRRIPIDAVLLCVSDEQLRIERLLLLSRNSQASETNRYNFLFLVFY